MKHYWVTTPEYEYEEWVDDYLLADRYPVRDYVSIEAKTKREAIKKGVAKLREDKGSYRDYYHWYWDRNTNPYTGVKAEIATCKHGICECDICTATKDWSECEQCLKEWEQEDGSER